MTEKILDDIVEKITQKASPSSIFLYGSRARDDATKRSDYEIGVLFTEDEYINRSALRGIITNENISIYPFEITQFKQGELDTPFNKRIYVRELVVAGKTLYGEQVIENMPIPSISAVDILADVQFNLGYALAATIANRDGATTTANLLFYKSVFFATRALIILEQKKMFITYTDIYQASKQLELGDYAKVLDAAHKARNDRAYDIHMLYKNISYINQYILPKIEQQCTENAHQIILP